MGYDMHTVIKPEGEARAVERAGEAFHKAVAVRDALPKSEAGRATRAEIELGGIDVVPANASERYRVAQTRVHEAYETLNKVERSCFRLNIWGMGKVREAMYRLGMAYDVGGYDHSMWPQVPGGDWDSPGGRVTEAVREFQGDPGDREAVATHVRQYMAKYHDGMEPTDALIDAYLELAAHCGGFEIH